MNIYLNDVHVLTFDAESHTYKLNGRGLPSVTQVLAPLIDYSMVAQETLERAARLGQAVHKMTELWDNDDLDIDSLSDELRPYLDAWIKFRAETGFVPLTIECQMAHPGLGFAGTSDRTGILKGRESLIDIKKMLTLGPVIGPQTAAYKSLHALRGDIIQDRYGLGLRPDGTYRLKKYEDPLDWQCFLSLLTIKNWRLKNGHQVYA